MNNRNGSSTMGTSGQEVGEKLDDRIDSIKDSVKTFVDTAEKKATAIRDRAIEVKDDALKSGKNALDHATDFIKANPIKAVGIAFGVGYLGMRIFR